MLPTKEEFISYISLIKKKQNQQNKLCDAIEEISGGYTMCDFFIFEEYENALYSLLHTIFNDNEDLIGIALYEFNGEFESDKNTLKDIYPEIKSWGDLYDHLISHLKEGE